MEYKKMKTYFKAFKNDAKKEGDTKPIFLNSNVVVKEKIIFDPNKVYSLGVWKNNDGTLRIKIELKDEQFIQRPDI